MLLCWFSEIWLKYDASKILWRLICFGSCNGRWRPNVSKTYSPSELFLHIFVACFQAFWCVGNAFIDIYTHALCTFSNIGVRCYRFQVAIYAAKSHGLYFNVFGKLVALQIVWFHPKRVSQARFYAYFQKALICKQMCQNVSVSDWEWPPRSAPSVGIADI